MLHNFKKTFNLENIIALDFISDIFNENIFNEKNINQNKNLEEKMGNGKLKNAIIAGLTLLSVANPFATLTSKAHSFDIKAHNQAVEAEKEKTRQAIKKWKIEVIPQFEKDIADNLPFYKENIEDHNNMLNLFKENLDIHHEIFSTYGMLLRDKIRVEKKRKTSFKGCYMNFNRGVSKSFRDIEIKTLEDTQAFANLLILVTNIYTPKEAHRYYYDLSVLFSSKGKLNAKNSPNLFQRAMERNPSVSIFNNNIEKGYLSPEKPIPYISAIMAINPNKRHELHIPRQILTNLYGLGLLAGITGSNKYFDYYLNQGYLKDKKFMEYVDKRMNESSYYGKHSRDAVAKTFLIEAGFRMFSKKNVLSNPKLIKKITNELSFYQKDYLAMKFISQGFNKKI